MSFESYIVKNGKKLRRGYTTGSSAATAAKAATKILFSGKEIKMMKIDTPAGIELNLEIMNIKVKNSYVRASVIKDGGDDPDVTDGLEIIAQVEEIDQGIKICGGKGVGRVTKPGLPVAVGEAAINPVPHQMIKSEVSQVLPKNKGVKITIEVPQGEEIATKTFNPKLGIKGGISILGTTGIVEPMSEKAYKESLALKVNQALAAGERELVLIFGNYGQRKAKKLGYTEQQIIRMSNFVGFMLDHCVQQGAKKVILIGHIGKLVKVAAGIFNTHSHVTDARRETIAAYTASIGGNKELINQILGANTAEETIGLINEAELNQVFDLLAKQVVNRVKDYVQNQLQVKSLIFSLEGQTLGKYNL